MPLKRSADTASLELSANKCVGGRGAGGQGRRVTPPQAGTSADLGDSSDYPCETLGNRRGAGFCVKVKLPQLSRRLCTEEIPLPGTITPWVPRPEAQAEGPVPTTLGVMCYSKWG